MAASDKITGAVAVIGGGVTGIQSALDLAGMGFKVYLIEKKPAIGGHMAMLDKTFPTNDCSLCILSPKLVECGRHKDIEILTLSTVTALEGRAGDFTLRVHKEPRFVDEARCTSCGDCAEKCPVKIPDVYERGLAFRKAIYKYYPQAIPNAYLIDKEGFPPDYKGCVECRICEKTCGLGAINLDAEAGELELKVGAVIIAEGPDAFQPYVKPEFGYGRFMNVVTSLEFERILSASGPYGGKIRRPGDRAEPERIAWIQCVGSRDRQVGNEYCSSVCCMYATKEAIITKEHAPGVEASIFYIDMRAHGKDFDQYVDRAEAAGVRYVRSRVSELVEDPESGDLFIRYEDDAGALREERFGMVVLSIGLCVSEAKRKETAALGVNLNEYGFCESDPRRPGRTSREGVFVAGAVSEPMAIPEAVMQASAAACDAAGLLKSARASLLKEKTFPPEKKVEGLDPRIGVFVCHCGTNIAGYLDTDALMKFAETLPGVVYAESPMYNCAQDSQKKMAELIKEHDLNRIVVAACSPRTHEPLFQETMKEAGLNPNLFEMANIRDQCSWIHMRQPEAAQKKARDLVAMAVAKARLLEPVPARESDVTPVGLVLGGGVAGMSAALGLAEQGFKTWLVEKEPVLGGRLNNIHYTIDGLNVADYVADMIRAVEDREEIEVLTESRLEKLDGYVGNFTADVATPDGPREIRAGAAVVAVGTEEAQTGEYLFGENPRVVTQRDLEERLANMYPGDIPDGETFVMIQCVGSRTEDAPWCSRVCCTQAVKNALKIKKINPRAEVYVLYRDMRTYGFKEKYYEEAREKGVVFLRYDPSDPPEARPEKEGLVVAFKERIMRERIEIPADWLVLSLGLHPVGDRGELAKLLKVPLNEDGFFMEAHVKLRPVDFATEGVFLAGCCHHPKFIDESASQGAAAAARAARILSRDKYESAAEVCVVDVDRCSGCGVCVGVCSYSAIELEDPDGKGERLRSKINEALCKGCGCCAAACPGGAIDQKGFTSRQLEDMLRAALSGRK